MTGTITSKKLTLEWLSATLRVSCPGAGNRSPTGSGSTGARIAVRDEHTGTGHGLLRVAGLGMVESYAMRRGAGAESTAGRNGGTGPDGLGSLGSSPT